MIDRATMRVSEVMVRDPVTFHPDTPVNELAKTMRERSIASVVLVKEDKPVGIVTERTSSTGFWQTGETRPS